ncbi:MAG: hypothetical protein HZB40_18665 [Rhodocyclales bacterium]|nr:hypothetical protein [Rhodocyclales bacterium]
MTSSFTQQNLRELARIYTQEGIAKKVGHGLNQRQISGVIHGERRLATVQSHAIEREFGIPRGWLSNYPIKYVLSLLRELRQICPDDQKLELLHRFLKTALDNAPSRTPVA